MKNINSKIDRLGHLNEAIASLKKEADSIRSEFKKANITKGHTNEFDLDVVIQTRSYLDQTAVKAKLSPQFLAAHTRKAEVKSFRITRIDEIEVAA
jgi:hypothetical protein